jgi:uncharacterized protein YoxC
MELEKQVVGVEKEMQDMISAVRSLTQQSNNIVLMLGKLSDEVAGLKGKLSTLKSESDARSKQESNITRY